MSGFIGKKPRGVQEGKERNKRERKAGEKGKEGKGRENSSGALRQRLWRLPISYADANCQRWLKG